MEKMSISSVWPLRGTVHRAYLHYYSNGEVTYPPAGFLQEVSYYTSMSENQVGKFERDNCDIFYLAWLMKLQKVQDDPEELQRMKESANSIPVRFNLRDNNNAKLLAAYQNREDEEKNAELLGHSLLTRGRELVGFQDSWQAALATNTVVHDGHGHLIPFDVILFFLCSVVPCYGLLWVGEYSCGAVLIF